MSISRRLSSISSTSTRSSLVGDRGKKTNCEICNEKFGVLHREHMCKRCLRAVCSSCGKQKKKIVGYQQKPDVEHRICTPCKKESDRLEEMVKENGMMYGCDSKVVPTWLNTMGIQNWPDVEKNFKQMLKPSDECLASKAYSFLQVSMTMSLYSENLAANYSFQEMFYLSQQESRKKPHDMIKDTLTAFISVNYDRVGYSNELVNLAMFLLCFSSPPKAYCILERIYQGDIIPQHLFPRAEESQASLLVGSPQRQQCYEQIMKPLKEKFKCDTPTLQKIQIYLNEIGNHSLESLLIGYMNFETCYTVFDLIMTSTTPSKYTQIIRLVVSFLYLNREIIVKKSGGESYEIAKDILDFTQRENLMLQIKWKLSDLQIPVFEDKLKEFEANNQMLKQQSNEQAAQFQTLTQEYEELKEEHRSMKEEYQVQIGTLQGQIELLQAETKEQKLKYENGVENLRIEMEGKKSQDESLQRQMETSIGLLQAKNKQVESEKQDMEVKLKGLTIDLQLSQMKQAEELQRIKNTNESYEKVINQLNAEIKTRAETDQEFQTLRGQASQFGALSESVKVLQDLVDEKSSALSESEKHVLELSGELASQKTALETTERFVEDTQKSMKEIQKMQNDKITSLETVLAEQSSRYQQEIKEKSDILSQSMKEIAKVKADSATLMSDKDRLKNAVTLAEEELNQERMKRLKIAESISEMEESFAKQRQEKESNHQKSISSLKEDHAKAIKIFEEKIVSEQKESQDRVAKLETQIKQLKEDVAKEQKGIQVVAEEKVQLVQLNKVQQEKIEKSAAEAEEFKRKFEEAQVLISKNEHIIALERSLRGEVETKLKASLEKSVADLEKKNTEHDKLTKQMSELGAKNKQQIADYSELKKEYSLLQVNHQKLIEKSEIQMKQLERVVSEESGKDSVEAETVEPAESEEIQEMRRGYEFNQKSLKRSEEECESLREQVSNLEARIVECNLKETELGEQIQQLRSEIKVTGESYREEQGKSDKLRKEIEKLMRELQEKKDGMEEIQKEKQGLLVKIKEGEVKQDELRHVIDSADANRIEEQKREHQKIEKMTKMNEVLGEQLEQRKSELEAQGLRITNLTKQIVNFEEEIRQSKVTEKSAQDLISALKSELLAAQAAAKLAADVPKKQEVKVSINSAETSSGKQAVGVGSGLSADQESRLRRLGDLEEMVQMKTEENLILQTMIRQISANKPTDDSVSHIAFDKLRSEHSAMSKLYEASKAKIQKYIVWLMVKYAQLAGLRSVERENQVVMNGLKDKIVSLGETVEKLEIENSKKLNEVNSAKEAIAQQDKMIVQHLEAHQRQIITLSEENSDLLVHYKKAQNLVEVTSASLQQALAKIFLMSLEFNRLGNENEDFMTEEVEESRSNSSSESN